MKTKKLDLAFRKRADQLGLEYVELSERKKVMEANVKQTTENIKAFAAEMGSYDDATRRQTIAGDKFEVGYTEIEGRSEVQAEAALLALNEKQRAYCTPPTFNVERFLKLVSTGKVKLTEEQRAQVYVEHPSSQRVYVKEL